jgi:hypothetical protein
MSKYRSWARRVADGLLGRAQALLHGLGHNGEHPSRGHWPGPRTQFVWWFPEWCGLGFSRWEGHTLAWMYRWSLLCGFFEFRRWKPWNEAFADYDAGKK